MEVTYLISDIKWDCDDSSDITLPTSTTLKSDEPLTEDEISDWLTSNYGFCHKGFTYKEI